MSYKDLFRQLALSAALGFSGNAAVAGSPSMPPPVLRNPTPSAALLILSTSQSSKSSAKDPLADAPQSVRALTQRMRTPENQSVINSCFREYAIEEKPVHQVTASDAQRVVDCTDKKNIAGFLADATSNRAAIANLVVYETRDATAIRINDFSRVANKVAEECKGTEQKSVSAFAKCAERVNNNSKWVDLALVLAGMGATGTAVWGVAGYRHRRKYGTPENTI